VSGSAEARVTEYLAVGAVTALVLVYLLYALLVPEKF
jgi:K+-transporting ATPase KdpF subunit